MTATNSSNLSGQAVKDSRNVMHAPTQSHHRLIVRGAEAVVHSKTVHPINKYGNTKDEVSKVEGPAASTSYRMKNSGYVVIVVLAGLIIYSNMAAKQPPGYSAF